MNSIDYIIKDLTELRFNNYRLFESLSDEQVLEIYRLNQVLSREIKYTIFNLEVLLRNKVHRGYAHHFQDNQWMQKKQAKFQHEEVETIKKTIKKITKPLTEERIIAKISFGFWVRLFREPYSVSYTQKFLKFIFPKNSVEDVGFSLTQKDIRKILGRVERVRNMASHCENLLDLEFSLKIIHDEMIKLMTIMSPKYTNYFSSKDQFETYWKEWEEFKKQFEKKEKNSGI